MDKFGRNYLLLIEKRDGSLLRVELPFSVQFEIHRNSLSSANVAQLRIYNLAPETRGQIRKDQFDFGDQREIQFFAGYGKNLSVAFKGNISVAWSVREGVDMITQIESFDGGFAYINSITGQSFNKNTPQKTIIDSMAQSLSKYGVSKGAIGSYVGKIARGNTYNGSTPDLLNELTGGGFFIDNGEVNCLNDTECLDYPVPLVNASTGLLGTPILEQTYINFEMIFEPTLKVAQLIDLESLTADRFNGRHKVLSIRHMGMISDSVCGTAISSVGLLPGTFTPVAKAAVTQ